MKWLSVVLVTVMALGPAASLWPAPAHAQQPAAAGSLTVQVTGTVQQPGNGSGRNSFVGSFTITRFAVQEGRLVAIGTLVGTAGNAPIGITTIAMPVDTTASGGVSRALSIDLLGLQIDLNQVVLDITAQAGAGNLLGNLLCAIVGLLDPLGPLTELATLLNQLLALLLG